MKNKKTIKILQVVSAVVLAGICFLLGFNTGRGTYDSEELALIQILEAYRKYYLFEKDDPVDIVSDALLEKYSEYYTKEEYEEMLEAEKGSNSGIGLGFKDDDLTIVSVVNNSPAKRAGITSGGVIVSSVVDGKETNFTCYDEFGTFVKAQPEDTDFTLYISYDGELKEYSVRKEKYQRTYVEYCSTLGYFMFEGDIGDISVVRSGDGFIKDSDLFYIKYTAFEGNSSGLSGSYGQFKEAMDCFSESGATKIILDLRENGGGSVSILNKIASLIVPSEKSAKKLVGYAVDKNGNREDFYSDASSFPKYNPEKIYILADINTASASEMLIGACLDWDYNDIVKVFVSSSTDENGETVFRTYGKGIMQTTYRYYNGSGIKLTTAKIYWPESGISIHGTGITGGMSEKVVGIDGSLDIGEIIEIIGG